MSFFLLKETLCTLLYKKNQNPTTESAHMILSCYYCPAVHNGHSVQQKEPGKQSLCYCWEKAFFLSQTQISRSFPHDNNKDFIILTKEQIWCAFRIKNLVHEIGDAMTQRAAKPSSREGDSLEVRGTRCFSQQPTRADVCRTHTGDGRCGVPGAARTAAANTQKH